MIQLKKKRETIKTIPVEVPKKRPAEKIEEKPTKKEKIIGKKKLTWAPDDKLHRYHTYTKEVEIEVKTSTNAYQLEKNLEKKLIQERKESIKNKLSQMQPTTQWISPQFNGFDIDRGFESDELHVQDKRCSQEEPKYYLNHLIPDTPSSPIIIIPDEKEDILQTLTQNPHMLSQLLGMIQPQKNDSFMNTNSYHPPPPHMNDYLINNDVQPNNQKSKSIRCKFYNTNVGCRNGSNCPFYHG